jgi:hypothetical protein
MLNRTSVDNVFNDERFEVLNAHHDDEHEEHYFLGCDVL